MQTQPQSSSASPQVQEQQQRQDVNLAEEGPAAAGEKAQKALQAVKEKPQNSTDPDRGACAAHSTPNSILILKSEACGAS